MFLLPFFNKKFFLILTVFVLTVVLLLTGNFAINKGQTKAKAQASFYNLQNMVLALNYFYNDQDRYPTALEFSSADIMAWYLNKHPVEDIVSDNCASSFRYARMGPKKYDIFFCLAEGIEGYKAGWNKYSVVK